MIHPFRRAMPCAARYRLAGEILVARGGRIVWQGKGFIYDLLSAAACG